MSAPRGTVRVYRDGPALTFQLVGWATITHGYAVRRCADQQLAGGAASLRVDLRHCSYMDSTFIGTLLFLKRIVAQQDQGTFALMSPSPQCLELLHQMKLDTIFPIETAAEPAVAWVDLPIESEEVRAFQRSVVQAHQALASVEGPAGEPFRSVVRCLAQELEGGESQDPSQPRPPSP